MEEKDRYALNAYVELAALDDSHRVLLVKNRYSNKLFIKKQISSYDLSVYRHLFEYPAAGMPRIAELVEDSDGLTVIEEYISGDTLGEKLAECGTFTPKYARQIISELCTILKELHPDIIHRDIKPDNIIVLPNGSVMLLDVNAAKWYTPEKERDTRLIGTKGYAAPEQYGFAGSDARTDIYALGVLLNVMLTGKTPQEKLAAGAEGKIVRKCTQLRPGDRYADVTELSAAISGLNSGEKTPETQYKHAWQCFLPPGFRSLRPDRVLGAAVGYTIAFSMILTLSTNGADGVSYINMKMNACIAGMFVMLVLLWSDYLGIQEYLPMSRSRNLFVKGLGNLLYSACIVIMALVTSAVFA